MGQGLSAAAGDSGQRRLLCGCGRCRQCRARERKRLERERERNGDDLTPEFPRGVVPVRGWGFNAHYTPRPNSERRGGAYTLEEVQSIACPRCGVGARLPCVGNERRPGAPAVNHQARIDVYAGRVVG